MSAAFKKFAERFKPYHTEDSPWRQPPADRIAGTSLYFQPQDSAGRTNWQEFVNSGWVSSFREPNHSEFEESQQEQLQVLSRDGAILAVGFTSVRDDSWIHEPERRPSWRLTICTQYLFWPSINICTGVLKFKPHDCHSGFPPESRLKPGQWFIFNYHTEGYEPN